MALFLRVGEDSVQASPRGILALILLAILVRCMADFFLVGSSGEWTADGLPVVLFPIALSVIAATLVAEFSGDPSKLALPMTVLLAIVLPIDGFMGAFIHILEIARMPGWAFALPGIAPVWMALAATKAMASLLDAKGMRRVAVSLSLMVVVALPLAAIQRTDSLWSPLPGRQETSYDKKYDALTGEEAFYLQPKLLEHALAGLRRQHMEQTELFFVGLAGDAEQGVFLREVQAVETIMGERFGTSGHAVVLANNYHAAMDYPLASVTGLRQTLRRVGEFMDKENDILFLFITSHGSRDHSIVLDFWPLRFNALNPEVLRRVLDESGIQWRVVVVSSCYSGGFIESLRDEKSIVITASAPDRTSFGCNDENDWTYFGKAFFDQALRHENDLAAAFDEAQRTIARREEEERVDIASVPMIAIGSAMNEKWRSFVKEQASFGPSVKTTRLLSGGSLQKLQ